MEVMDCHMEHWGNTFVVVRLSVWFISVWFFCPDIAESSLMKSVGLLHISDGVSIV